MDKIRSWLFIGVYRDTLNQSYLNLKNIQAMLQLAGMNVLVACDAGINRSSAFYAASLKEEEG